MIEKRLVIAARCSELEIIRFSRYKWAKVISSPTHIHIQMLIGLREGSIAWIYFFAD